MSDDGQTEVQLAACLMAAEGSREVADIQPGDYAYTLALDKTRALREERDNLRGAMKAGDERLRAAERLVWGDETTWGCDAPEHLAEEMLALREERDLLDYTCRALTKRNEDLCWTPVGRPNWVSAMLKIAAKLLGGEKATMEDGHTLASAARGAREEWDTARSELSRLRARIAELEDVMAKMDAEFIGCRCPGCGALSPDLRFDGCDCYWHERSTALAAGEEK